MPPTIAEQLRDHVADHACSHPGCDRFGPFGTGMIARRGAPNAHGLRPLVLMPGLHWWCRAHRPPAEQLSVDLPPVHAPVPPKPKQGTLL